jgi:hypothetical protein
MKGMKMGNNGHMGWRFDEVGGLFNTSQNWTQQLFWQKHIHTLVRCWAAHTHTAENSLAICN